MQLKNILFLATGSTLLACSTPKEQVCWVHAVKVPCDAEATQNECLQISKNDDLNQANWELLAVPIENFVFEEGFFKKIQVQQTPQSVNKATDGATSVQYIMIKEIEKQKDMTFDLAKDWALETLNGTAVTQALKPTLHLQPHLQKIHGIGGCNHYFGTITQLDQGNIVFGNVGATKMMCMEDKVEALYFKALSEVRKYAIVGEQLILFDASGKEVLVFSPKPPIDMRLQEVWQVVRIDAKAVEKLADIPKLEINLTEMSIHGNDSCNGYFASIESLTEDKITFGDIATTAKLCSDMQTAHRYHEALAKVVAYRIDGETLLFYDAQGNERLAFIKMP